MFTIVSWNVNGIRAFFKKGSWEKFISKAPDMFTLQETKATVEQLPPSVRNIEGFYSYFTQPEEKKGYSGVAFYSRYKPRSVSYGMGIPHLDREGRLITALFDSLAVCSCYFPNGGGPPERFAYKLDFFDAFLAYSNALREKGYSVLFAGDVNVAHEEIDLARPTENTESPGFRIEARECIDEIIRNGYVDTFRHVHPKKVQYSYWDMKTRARDRNVGWRIDYVFISNDLVGRLQDAFILDSELGSDHCPVGATLDIDF